MIARGADRKGHSQRSTGAIRAFGQIEPRPVPMRRDVDGVDIDPAPGEVELETPMSESRHLPELRVHRVVQMSAHGAGAHGASPGPANTLERNA